MSLSNPPKHQLLVSASSSPVLGSNPVTNITGQCSNYTNSDGYQISYKDANTISIRTANGDIGFIFNPYNNTFVVATSGYYRLILYY